MKSNFLIATLLWLDSQGFSQNSNDPVEVTAAVQTKIKTDIEREIPAFRKKFKTDNPAVIEFHTDTFRIERFMEKWIDLDYRDYSMRDAGYEAARLYDSLLNKYYKKLMAILKDDDKKILTQAQKSWLTFRDNEMKLTLTISKDQYSGGGTMQILTESSTYLDLIRRRLLDIFAHYTRAAQID